jgi:hypothetical protein
MLHDGFWLGCFSTLKMEVIWPSETSVHIRTTRRYIPEDNNLVQVEYRLLLRQMKDEIGTEVKKEKIK